MFGQMVRPIKANGSKTKCTGMASCAGKTASSTAANLRTISVRVGELSRGAMAGSTRATGMMENNMDKEFSLRAMVRNALESGKTEGILNG